MITVEFRRLETGLPYAGAKTLSCEGPYPQLSTAILPEPKYFMGCIVTLSILVSYPSILGLKKFRDLRSFVSFSVTSTNKTKQR